MGQAAQSDHASNLVACSIQRVGMQISPWAGSGASITALITHRVPSSSAPSPRGALQVAEVRVASTPKVNGPLQRSLLGQQLCGAQ